MKAPHVPGFRIVSRIGRGGMGEVYRAIRIGPAGFKHSVAIKQLKQEKAIEGDAVRRFLNEARISGQLDHPNLVRVHDLLLLDGYFLVMELLRGRTASEAFRDWREQHGPTPWWIAAEVADQALLGLEYAHARELVHRDLTPRNVFLTEAGVVKILDFGIAKLRNALTPALTETGHLQGTLAFLAPEQARAEESDARSDLYQLAGMVYFALSGRAPHGDGAAGELIARAANGAPVPLAELRGDLPSELGAWIERGMARERAARFGSAAEMRAALEPLMKRAPVRGAAAIAAFLGTLSVIDDDRADAEISELQAIEGTLGATRSARKKPRARVLLAVVVPLILIASLLLLYAKSSTPPHSELRFSRLSFQRGTMISARFTPDGTHFVYTARWEDRPSDTFIGSPNDPEARSLDLKGAELVGLSRTGEMAILIDTVAFHGFLRRGTLAKTNLAGGASRELLENVQWADWTPSGALAVLRWSGPRTTLELPQGNVLFSSDVEAIQGPRLSPDGSKIAFVLHAVRMDTRGRVAVIDASGALTMLTEEWNNLHGVAWRGDEILFSGDPERTSRRLWSVEPGREPRLVAATPGSMAIEDVAPDGRLLAIDEKANISIGAFGGDGRQRDLSQFDMSYVADLSADGAKLLFGDSGDALGSDYGVFLRGTDGSPAVRLDRGVATALSPDGLWATATSTTYRAVRIVPTRTGESRELGFGSRRIDGVSWFPDGARILVSTEEELAIVDVESGARRALSRRDLHFTRGTQPISPDGKTAVVVEASTESLVLLDLESGDARPLPGAIPGERPLRWSADGGSIFVARFGSPPVIVHRLDVGSGERTRQAELMPADPTGVVSIVRAVITPDGETVAFNYLRVLSTLYLVDDSLR